MNVIQRLFRRRITASVTASATLAAAAASGLLLWPEHASTTIPETPVVQLVSPADEPDGPVEITGLDTNVVWSDQGTSVTMQVTNRSDEPVDATVWWLLALPGEQEPWDNPKAAGERTDVRLRANTTQKVTVPVEKAPASGSYVLSLWAHQVLADGGTRHSHGVNAQSLIHVLPVKPDVTRLNDPGRYATLTVIEPVGRLLTADPKGTGPDALVSVQSTSQQPVEVALDCYLAPIRTGRTASSEPWTDRQAVASESRQVIVSDAVPEVLTCRFDELPHDGDWQLSAFLRRAGAEEGGTHEDGLYSRRTVTFQD